MPQKGSDNTSVKLIDLLSIVRKRLWRHTPAWLVRPLEKLVRQREMNDILLKTAGMRGADFCRGVLKELNFSYSVNETAGALPAPDDKRVVYVSNHPLGGLDGLALIDMISAHHGGARVHFIVNDLLSAVEPLSDVFIPVNKHGSQSRAASERVDAAFAGPEPVIVFPAGLVSRKQADGSIADLKWHKMFVTKAIASGRDVIPLYFDACNTNLFYNFASIRQRLGLKFNFEMVLLPSEVFKSRNKRATVSVGKRIASASLGGARPADVAAAVRTMTLALRPGNH